MNILLIVLLNLPLQLFNCATRTTSGENDPLPDSRPEEFVIEYHLDGGMRYYSEALYISGDSSYYTVNDGGAVSRVNFKLNAKELDELYKIFADNGFDRIKTNQQQVYDRGGSSIHLRWKNGKFASVSNSGMSFVDKGWANEWKACMDAVTRIIEQQSALQRKDYEFRFDRSFFGKELTFYVNNQLIISKKILAAEHENENYISKPVKLIPGSHRISVNWGGGYDNIQVNSDSTKGVNLIIVNDSLKHEFLK